MVNKLKPNVTPETNRLDIVRLLVKKGVMEERARQIVERFF